MERRRELDKRYEDAEEGPNAVAGGGVDWKQSNSSAATNGAEQGTKRARSPDDEADADEARAVSADNLHFGIAFSHDFGLCRANECGRKNQTASLSECRVCLVLLCIVIRYLVHMLLNFPSISRIA